jgi:hypothetical protein
VDVESFILKIGLKVLLVARGVGSYFMMDYIRLRRW